MNRCTGGRGQSSSELVYHLVLSRVAHRGNCNFPQRYAVFVPPRLRYAHAGDWARPLNLVLPRSLGHVYFWSSTSYTLSPCWNNSFAVRRIRYLQHINGALDGWGMNSSTAECITPHRKSNGTGGKRLCAHSPESSLTFVSAITTRTGYQPRTFSLRQQT